jgi:hypothetical protein
MFRPIRSKRISQHFGENRACVYANGKIVGKQGNSCPRGAIDFYKDMGMKGHNGMDMPGILGEHVCHAATFDGWMRTESDYSGGLGVDVISNEPVYFEGKRPEGVPYSIEEVEYGFLSYVKLRYWHLHGYIGETNKDVKFGQPIGLLGSTGASSAPHLHWSYKFCDKDGNAYNLNNGYYGAYDPDSKVFDVSYDHSIFSADSARMLNIPKQLTQKEEIEIRQKISTIRNLILQLRELIARL